MERLLRRIILLLASVLRSGDILDAGANDGRDTAALAEWFAGRTVHGVEPLEVNFNALRSRSKAHANMRIVHGGLSSHSGISSYSENAERAGPGSRSQTGLLGNYLQRERTGKRVNYTLTTIDTMFQNRTLAFAHLDLEGHEHSALQGATATISRDQPIMSVEAFPRAYSKQYHALASYVINELRYSMFTIPEVCGGHGCRNYLCLPSWVNTSLVLEEAAKSHVKLTQVVGEVENVS